MFPKFFKNTLAKPCPKPNMRETQRSLNLANLLYLKTKRKIKIDSEHEIKIKIELSRFMNNKTGARIDDKYKYVLVRMKNKTIPGTNILDIKAIEI